MRRELGRDDLPASASPPTSGPAQMTELTNATRAVRRKRNPIPRRSRIEAKSPLNSIGCAPIIRAFHSTGPATKNG